MVSESFVRLCNVSHNPYLSPDAKRRQVYQVKDSYKMWARRNYGASVFPDSLYWCDALAFALHRRREMLCKIYHFIHGPRPTAKSLRGTNLYRVCSLGH